MMSRSGRVRALLVATGVVAVGIVILWRAQNGPIPDEHGVANSRLAAAGALGGVGGAARQADIERRLKLLEAASAEAAGERRRLTAQLDALAAQLAARPHGSDETMRAASGPPAAAPEAAATAASDAAGLEAGKSSMERALVAAGLDPAAAADIKRRHDGLAMAEMYLRDQATREHWLNSPRFASEMAAINAQRTPLRNEIGDDAYDRYLFALGQTNRVRVDEVLTQSPAEQAGLQPGDLIVRYGDARLFAPGELVDQTRSGTPGEAVQLEILRNGERLEVQVPRGPLGLRIAATQGAPDAS